MKVSSNEHFQCPVDSIDILPLLLSREVEIVGSLMKEQFYEWKGWFVQAVGWWGGAFRDWFNLGRIQLCCLNDRTFDQMTL